MVSWFSDRVYSRAVSWGSCKVPNEWCAPLNDIMQLNKLKFKGSGNLLLTSGFLGRWLQSFCVWLCVVVSLRDCGYVCLGWIELQHFNEWKGKLGWVDGN